MIEGLKELRVEQAATRVPSGRSEDPTALIFVQVCDRPVVFERQPAHYLDY